MRLIAFLLRYGPRSIDELLNKPVSFIVELVEAIEEIMREENSLIENM